MQQNELGIWFKNIDDTVTIAEGSPQSYLYRFVNRGQDGLLRDYVDDYHVEEALVAATTFTEASEYLTNESLGKSYDKSVFEVHLIGVDLCSDQGVRIIYQKNKRPME